MKNWKDLFPKENRYFETKGGILYFGDCLEIMRRFPSESIDLILTDPPYFGILKESWDNQWNTSQDYLKWYEKWVKISKSLMKNIGSFYVWCPALTKKTDISLSIYLLLKKYLLFQTLIVWRRQFTHGNSLWLQAQEWCFYFSKTDKVVKNPFRVDSDKFEKHSVRCSNVWYIRDVTEQGFMTSKEYVGHKAQKPLEVFERIVKASSNEENLVLDPFIGSGTTAVVCERLNRRWIGIEIEEKYCEIAKKRILKEGLINRLF